MDHSEALYAVVCFRQLPLCLREVVLGADWPVDLPPVPALMPSDLLPPATLALLELTPAPAWGLLQGYTALQLADTADATLTALGDGVRTCLGALNEHPAFTAWLKVLPRLRPALHGE